VTWRGPEFLALLIGPLLFIGTVEQGPGVPRPVVPPGVSCTAAQIEAGAKRDTNATHGITPAVQTSGAVDPCSLRVLRESSPWWTESVAEVVLPARFRPATSGGHAIRYVVTFRYRYQ
jgi:hypothetical protein